MPRRPFNDSTSSVWTSAYFTASATSWTTRVSGVHYPGISYTLPTPENMKVPVFDILPPVEDVYIGRKLGIYKDEKNNPRIGDSEFIDEELEFSTA